MFTAQPIQINSFERARLSVATRELLCDLATGDLDRPLRRLPDDWDEAFQAICRNSLLGLTRRYLAKGVSRADLPEDFGQAVQQAHYRSAVSMAVMYRHIGVVLRGMADGGIDHIALKGPALAHLSYPHPSLRIFGDLDLMVRERDMLAAHRLLVDLGFIPELDPAELPPKLVSQQTTYEVKYWHPVMALRVEVHYDDLLNAGLASRDVEGFWRRSCQVEIGGLPVRVLSLEDQLLHLCAHMHYHGYVRLNWFSDIAFIIRDRAADLDWARLVAITRREEAEVPVYYSLRLLERLLGIRCPRATLAAVRPDRFRRWWHERYLPEERVASLEPMPRPDFSFYFLPLLKRLLPDLLVMGRRREKVRYLVRLLAPPAVWLRAYYGLDARSSVTPHRLLHPLKLATHYAAEVVGAVAGRGTTNDGPSSPARPGEAIVRQPDAAVQSPPAAAL